MSNDNVTSDFGYFYDSGGSSTENIGMMSCMMQATYSNNENYVMTFNSTNGLPFQFEIDTLGFYGLEDTLKVFDGSGVNDPLLYVFTSNAVLPSIFYSSGSSITFSFVSGDNSSDMITGCDNGGNWAMTFRTTEFISIDEPGTLTSCNFTLVDDGILDSYSEGVEYTKTICPESANTCVKLEFAELELGAGDYLEVYEGNAIAGSPLYYFDENASDNILPINVEINHCLTLHFVSNSDGLTGSGFILQGYCTDMCIPVPQCITNDPANDQCINATQICNLHGYCGSTDTAYTHIAHNGTDWNQFAGLMDDFCGSIENNSWLSFVATQATSSLNIWTYNCMNDEGIQMQIYETDDCEDFVPVSNCVSHGYVSDFIVEATNLVPGQVYYLMIDGFAGDQCDYVVAANSGVDIGAYLVGQESICNGTQASIAVEGADTNLTTFSWYAEPADTSLAGQENNPHILVSPVDTTQYFCVVEGSPSNPFCPDFADTLVWTVNVANVGVNCGFNYDCEVEATANTYYVEPGDPVELHMDALYEVIAFQDDFEDGYAVGWYNTTEMMTSNPCGSGPQGNFLWMGNTNHTPRFVETQDLNLAGDAFMRFYLKYAIQGELSPCEGPDEPDEGVSVQYSTDFGQNWIDIAYFNPLTGAIETTNPLTNTPVATGPTNFTSWNYYELPLPAAAQTSHTRVRFMQDASTTIDHDHWGIDEFEVAWIPDNIETYWIANPDDGNVYSSTDVIAFPEESTLYTASFLYESGGMAYVCEDTVYVEVNPLSIEKRNKEKFDVFPVPAKDELNIIAKETESADIEIYASDGSKMEIILQGDCPNYKVDVSKFPKGNYFVQLNSRDQIYRKQFIKL